MNRTLKKVRDSLHLFYPLGAYLRYGLLGKKMTVIGITGTDGKSSSVAFTAHMLRTAGYQTAHYSSVSIHDGLAERKNESKISTPGRMGLHRFLADARRKGATHAVVEITSQGMIQHRHRAIGFTLVGVTNVTPEHIEAHGGFARYRKSKASLLRVLLPENRGAVLSDEAHAELADMIPARIPTTTCSFSGGAFRGTLHSSSLEHTAFAIEHAGNRGEIRMGFGGPFVHENALFSAGLALTLGVSLADVTSALATQVPVDGRCEVVSTKPLVIVDYAHTTAALEAFLAYMRRHTGGRIVHVFGAAGTGRDRAKRPVLARLSERYADISIVTEENPFDELEEHITREIRSGFSAAHDVRVVPKREDAVALAKSLLGPDDVLLLTGKGSETVIVGPRRQRRIYAESAYARWLFGTLSSV